MAKQVTLSVEESLKKIQKSLESLVPSLQEQVNQAVKEVAHAAYASIVAKAQAQLGRTRQDYLKGLSFEDLGDNAYLITLDGKFANALEVGYGPYDMRDSMLASKKIVGVGKRAGLPWVQNSKPKGKNKVTHKYAHVPMQVQPNAKATGSNMADAVKALTATNAQGLEQKLTKTFRDAEGKAIEGKVAKAKSTDPRLDGLVKYQKVSQSDSGKESVKSIYIRYRTVSENGRAWIHPGYEGLKAFADAEAEVIKQIDSIIKTLIK